MHCGACSPRAAPPRTWGATTFPEVPPHSPPPPPRLPAVLLLPLSRARRGSGSGGSGEPRIPALPRPAAPMPAAHQVRGAGGAGVAGAVTCPAGSLGSRQCFFPRVLGTCARWCIVSPRPCFRVSRCRVPFNTLLCQVHPAPQRPSLGAERWEAKRCPHGGRRCIFRSFPAHVLGKVPQGLVLSIRHVTSPQNTWCLGSVTCVSPTCVNISPTAGPRWPWRCGELSLSSATPVTCDPEQTAVCGVTVIYVKVTPR